MRAKRQPPRPTIGRAPPLPSERGLRLPHERDESPNTGPHPPRPEIQQAARDVERGLVDTEARGTPSNVPRGRGRRRRSAGL
jgi:hypothetical protein